MLPELPQGPAPSYRCYLLTTCTYYCMNLLNSNMAYDFSSKIPNVFFPFHNGLTQPTKPPNLQLRWLRGSGSQAGTRRPTSQSWLLPRLGP